MTDLSQYNFPDNKCPICQVLMKPNSFQASYSTVYDMYVCDNSTEVSFARARNEFVPDYHKFIIHRINNCVNELRLTLAIGNKVYAFSLRNKETRVMCMQKSNPILVLNFLVAVDFPELTKFKNKIATYINFS